MPAEAQQASPADGKAALQQLLRMGAPRELVRLCWWVLRAMSDAWPGPHIHALETFAGKAEVTWGHRACGRRAVPFERDDEPIHCDFLSSHGFCGRLRRHAHGTIVRRPASPRLRAFMFCMRGETGCGRLRPRCGPGVAMR